MADYNKLIISPWIYEKIRQFYINMSIKRVNVYGPEEIMKLIDIHYDSTYDISKLKYQADPIIKNWVGTKRLLIDEWNYAVLQVDDTFYVLDTCHYLNLHEKNPTVLDLDILPFRPTNITLAGKDSNRFIRCLVNEDINQSIMKKLNQKDLKNLMENKCDLEYLANKYFAKDILNYKEQNIKIKR